MSTTTRSPRREPSSPRSWRPSRRWRPRCPTGRSTGRRRCAATTAPRPSSSPTWEGDEDEQLETAGRLSEEFSGTRGDVALQFTGVAEVTRQVAELSESDLQKAELLSAPFTVIALIIVFGTIVSAFLPLVVGVVAVIGTFLVLTVITGFTDVSVFALNVTTGMGLGLGIDYSLFVVSRYREELAKGVGREVALSRTMQTAGRTVAFSAGTVMMSLLALLLFPIPYLRSFAYAVCGGRRPGRAVRHRAAARRARRPRRPGRAGAGS